MHLRLFLFLGFSAVVACSCGDSTSEVDETPLPVGANPAPSEEAPKGSAKAANQPKTSQQPPFWTEVKLHEAIRSANPGYSGNGQFQIDERGQVVAIAVDNCEVTDLSPFQGMNLMALYFQGCAVADISPLAGMPLVELYLEQSAVKDLSPLKGMVGLRKLYLSGTDVVDLSPIKGLGIVEMNLVDTNIENLSPLEGMPLQMLWLTDTPVSDISPLSRSPLVSLTLHRTRVSDLSPLANTALQRLHIGETPVTDLSPLTGLRLTRLVFDPSQIQKGMEAVKAIPTMREIGTKFEDEAKDLQSPAAFWSSLSE
ncbi:MAG: hypothetical protein AAGA96_07855 [Verrucomicrobiota bacterium]